MSGNLFVDPNAVRSFAFPYQRLANARAFLAAPLSVLLEGCCFRYFMRYGLAKHLVLILL
jgi:hypothetical protein